MFVLEHNTVRHLDMTVYIPWLSLGWLRGLKNIFNKMDMWPS